MSSQHLPIARVLSQQENTVQLQLEFTPDQFCFQGHFPELPVYPGVAQIALVDAFAQQYLGFQGICGHMEQIKFLRIIQPHDVLQLDIIREQNRVQFKLHQQEAKIASGQLIYQLTAQSAVPVDACA